MRTWTGLAVAGVAAAVAAGVGAAARPGDAPWHPLRLAHVGDARQVLVVTGNGARSTRATLRAFQLGLDGLWREALPAMPARNGRSGWQPAARRVEGDGSTPQGTFRISTAFGLLPDPGTKLPYRHADGDAHWAGDQRDPPTYNLLQPSAPAVRTWRLAHAERLADYPVQYAYAAVIDFNRPAAPTVTFDRRRHGYVTSQPADVRRGSAIFLHVNGRGATAGCVSLRHADLLKVLRWLDPADRPRIVLAPLAEISLA
jgi:L,D-peptidoglycan transpeptidase YkuD (ErfK/YbiS/YcfS/YnhG family)